MLLKLATITYAQVKVFGKYHEIPRQQVAYGDDGLKYTFSGVTVPAKNWIEPVKATRDLIASFTGIYYNFVLINRLVVNQNEDISLFCFLYQIQKWK